MLAANLQQLNLEGLSVVDRLELIGLLWDSIVETHTALPIPEWHLRELEKRRAAAQAHPEDSIPWETVKARRTKTS